MRRKTSIILSILASVLFLTTLFILLDNTRSQAVSHAAPRADTLGAVVRQQETYTPVVTIAQPTANAILTTTHLPTYLVQIEYGLGTSVITDPALLEVVSVTVDGGVTYHEAISNATLGRYTYAWPLTEDYIHHTLIARARNGWGNIGTSSPVTAYVDVIPPQGAITITDYTENTSFLVSWSATDGSGFIRYDLQYRRDDQASWTDWLMNTSQTSETFTVTSQVVEEGHTYTFRMAAWDEGSNRSDWVTAAVRVGKYNSYLPIVTKDYACFSNGSFEFGLAGWSTVEAPLPISVVSSVQEKPSGSTSPADGAKAALLGNTAYSCDSVPLGNAAVEQTFLVPGDATKLTFKYIIWSQDASPNDQFDRFEVYINDTPVFEDGNRHNRDLNCSNWWRVPGPEAENSRPTDASGKWAVATITEIGSYAGQTITLSFHNYSRHDNWYNTYTYIDDIRIE